MSTINLEKLRVYVTSGFSGIMAIAIFCGSSTLYAQRSISPADTGRMKWGHSDFSDYDRPTMCHRALGEATRQYTRRYYKDTALAPIVKNSAPIRELPKEAIETVRACATRLNLDSQTPDQLWAVARIYLVLGDLEKSKLVAEKVIQTGINSEEKLEMMLQALLMYLNHSESSLSLANYFADAIRAFEPVSNTSIFQVDITLAGYFLERYNVDSVLHYSKSAIVTLKKMSIEEMDKVAAISAFTPQLDIANEKGDIPQQEKILVEASELLKNWRSGLGMQMIAGILHGLDVKKTVYNKRMTVLNDGVWENSDGLERPKSGVASLIVLVNHNCGSVCYSRINAIKRLKKTFGDDLDVVLITTTSGFAPGSGPLTPTEEGKAAAKYFKDYLELPYPLLVDESPTYKLDDGRIIRDNGPLAQMFSDFSGTNAVVTDRLGRIQWAGALTFEAQIRLLASVIERAVVKESD